MEITRAEAVLLVKKQMDVVSHKPLGQWKGAVHYGYLELRELLDYLYGGPPKDPSEELLK